MLRYASFFVILFVLKTNKELQKLKEENAS